MAVRRRIVRYPIYRRNFTTSAAVLSTLIKVCQTRGMKPMLFELSRNTAIIGSSQSAPTAGILPIRVRRSRGDGLKGLPPCRP